MRRLATAALALVSIVLVAAALEAGLRWLAPQEFPLEGLFREHPVGLRHVPHYRRDLRTRDGRVRVAINGEGFRDREYPPPGCCFRILGLGDSFAFGLGVEEEETYLARLERALAGRRVEVINAGHVGMGPDNEALLLEAEGARLRPGLVLVGFFVGNDLWNVMTGPDRAVVSDGRLVSRPGLLERWHRPVQPGRILPQPLDPARASERPPGPLKRILRRSHVYRLVARRYAALKARIRDGERPRVLSAVDDEAVFLRDDPPEFRQGWTEVGRWLTRMAEWCRRHEATLVVAVIPTASQVHPQRWAEARERFGLRDEDFDLGKPQRMVAALAEQAGAAVIDLLPALRAAAAAGPPLYVPDDPHWTPRGHEVAAEELLRQLEGLQVLPDG